MSTATLRDTRLMCGKIMTHAKIMTTPQYHMIEAAFGVKDEIKAMRGAKWMGNDPVSPQKVWRVDNCRRNNFAIEYLEGKNPYACYKAPLVESPNLRLRRTRFNNNLRREVSIYSHQLEMTHHMLQKRQVVIAGEMGVGKTLSAFEAIELSLCHDIWYVAPKSALASVRLEAQVWGLRSCPRYMTYDEMKRILEDWPAGKAPPTFVVFDECSRLKTPTSQRSQAAYYLAENMRDAYGDKAYIVLMSGSPAPKSPLDWWFSCEIACPGYLREGTIEKFRDRLAIVTKEQGMAGGMFPKLLGWRDGNPNICNVCGKPEEHVCHNEGAFVFGKAGHEFVPCTNEVNKLYQRMGGLVVVKMKADCLDLPEKIYRQVKVKPSMDTLRAARMVASGARTAIENMTLLRELSDGFQYQGKMREIVCTACKGVCSEAQPCVRCGISGKLQTEDREIVEVPCPKFDALNDLLEENEEIGRLVVYAGFTASIDRVCKYVKDRGWHFIRVDGRGWINSINPSWDQLAMLREFQSKTSDFDKIVFVGHPGSAGMGLTLTAASMLVYFSNDFNAESRIQSEDRIHRAGMDANRGATIVDLLHLPTDAKVLENLRRKRELQSITLNEIQAAMDAPDV